MPIPQHLTPPRSKLADVSLLAALGLLIHGWIVLAPSAVMGFTDALDYLLLADYFRGLIHGDASARAEQLMGVSRYPPLYPALLGALGGGSGHQHAAMLVSNSAAVVAVLSLWFWANNEYGRVAAAVIAASLLLYPQFFLLNLHTVSEPLSVAMIATALLLIANRHNKNTLMVLGITLAALAPLVRAANLPILPAMAIALVMSSSWPRSRIALVTGLALAPSAFWYLIRPLTGAEAYTASIDPHFMLLKMGGWPDAVWLQPWRLFTAFIANWGSPGSALGFLLAVVIVGLAAIGGLDRARQGRADAWFLIGYLGLVVVWPYPAEFQRLLVPVYPLVLGCVVHALRLSAGAALNRDMTWSWRRGVVLLAMAILLVQLPAMWRFLHRATMPVDADLIADKRRVEYFTLPADAEALSQIEKYARVRGVATATRDALPPGACVYAADPRLLLAHAGVTAISYPPGIDDLDSARQALVACDYFFVSAFGMGELGLAPGYPLPHLAEWTTPVLLSQQANGDNLDLAAALFVRR